MYEKKKPQTVVKYETLIQAIFLSVFCCCCCCCCFALRSSFDRIYMQIVSYQSRRNCDFQRLSLHPHRMPATAPLLYHLICGKSGIEPIVVILIAHRRRAWKTFHEIFHANFPLYSSLFRRFSPARFSPSLFLFSALIFPWANDGDTAIADRHFVRENDVCSVRVYCAYRLAGGGVERRKRPISHNFSITFTFI